MLLTAIVTLYVDGILPLIIPVIIIGKELLMVYGGLFLYFRKSKVVMPANKVGKSATLIYTAAVFVTIIFPMSIASILLLIAAVVTKLTAMGIYLNVYYKKIKPDTIDKTT